MLYHIRCVLGVCVCVYGGDQPLLKDSKSKILLIIKHCFQYSEPHFDVIKSHAHIILYQITVFVGICIKAMSLNSSKLFVITLN